MTFVRNTCHWLVPRVRKRERIWERKEEWYVPLMLCDLYRSFD